jgi:ClpP class serine protease
MESYHARIKAFDGKPDIEIEPETKTVRIFGREIVVPDVLESVSDDGTQAVINIVGPMSQDGPSPIDLFFGENGVAYSDIRAAFQDADDMMIGSEGGTITVNINTPGGEVSGVDETRTVIKDIESRREIVFINRGAMTSGGEFLASGGTRVLAGSEVDRFGSIGVVTNILDFSEAMKRFGIENHIITNTESKDKRPDVSTEEGRQIIRDQLDEVFDVFKDRMIESGVSEEVIKELAGRVVLTRKAIDVGLADSIIGTESGRTISDQSMSAEDNPPADAGTNQEEVMNLQEAMTQNPAIKAEVEALEAKAAEAGAAKEREAVQSRINAASPYLSNKDYPTVAPIAVKVLAGEASEDILTATVAAIDAVRESVKSDEAADVSENTEATPPADPASDKGSEDQIATDSRVDKIRAAL